jgi:hypothetical protein
VLSVSNTALLVFAALIAVIPTANPSFTVTSRRFEEYRPLINGDLRPDADRHRTLLV